jgi:hypothetical protein
MYLGLMIAPSLVPRKSDCHKGLADEHIIADALIDQSKQETPTVRVSRVTAYRTELESRGYVRIADYTSKWKVSDWKSVNPAAFPGTDLDGASLSGLLRM